MGSAGGRPGAVQRLEGVLNNLLEGLTAVCLLTILLIVITLVVLRYLFNSSITGANELVTVLFVYSTAIGAAVGVSKREHITIAVVAERLPRSLRRGIDALGLLLVAGLNGVLVWHSVTWIRVTGGFLMPSTELPRVVAQISLPIGCGLASLACAVRLVLALTGDEELGEAWATDDEADPGRARQ